MGRNRTQIVKPISWGPVSPGFIAPAWRKFWRGLIFACPMWSGGGPARSYGRFRGTGTLTSGGSGLPTWEPERYGRGVDFKKDTDLVDFGDHGDLDITGELTSAALFKVDVENSNNQGIIAKYRSQSGQTNQRSYKLNIGTQTNAMSLEGVISDDGTFKAAGVITSAANTLVLDTWHFGVYRVIPSTRMDLWIDGVEVASDTVGVLGSIHSGPAPLWLGHEFDSTDATSGLDGPIAVTYVWNRALSRSEIVQLTADPFGPFRMDRRAIGFVAAVGANAPTGVIYGPLYGPLAGPI